MAMAAVAQEEAEDSPFRPGLVATYSAGGQAATRVDEVVAFDWQDAAADERLAAGEFAATWRGRLWARGAGEYRLSCYVQGEVEIKLGGKTLIEGRSEQPGWLESQPVALDFDHHPIEIQYRRNTPQGQLKLFWSGPDFRLEPLPAWALVHEREQSPVVVFERGRQLAAALRCGACHKDKSASMVTAPALDRLSGNVNEAWLVDWLASHGEGKASGSSRRMPDLGMSREEAEAVAAWLVREPAVKNEPRIEQKETKVTKDDSTSKTTADSKSKKKKGEEKPKPSAEEGEKLLLTRGCLACHQLGALGLSGLFGGGDLTALFQKRPADFFMRWLADPGAINREHRMPVFQFTADEMTSLGLWAKRVAAVGNALRGVPSAAEKSSKRELIKHGEKLVASFKCAACHSLSREKTVTPAADQKELTAASDWARSCAGQPRREKGQPGYRLVKEDAEALKTYYTTARPSSGRLSMQARGRDLLAQLNCLACHQREGVERATLAGVGGPALAGASLSHPTGDKEMVGTAHPTLPALQDKLAAVAEAHGDLAALVPAMTPPALNSVGDKLVDAALEESIVRKGRPHRPYLLVQMPKFELSKEQLGALTAYFVATDRISERRPHAPREEPKADAGPTAGLVSRSETATKAAFAAAGPRLVTTDGLACTSCHQVGSVLPMKAPLNARGPDMSMLGSRIRREWFDRWCNNPARIVPRMEMPAVKIPVRGVLNDNVEDQLAAVWHILNTPGFQPPEPDPVRVLRLSGIPEKNERPIVIHDVVKDGEKTYLFPLVIGLPNRHNVLFDLETNRLAAWWLGDTARQRTKGKSWYWEMGGKSIFEPGFSDSELSLWIEGKQRFPEAISQFQCELGEYSARTSFPETKQPAEVILNVERSFPTTEVSISNGGKFIKVGGSDWFWELNGSDGIGVRRDIALQGHGTVNRANFRVVSEQAARAGNWDPKSRTFRVSGIADTFIRVGAPEQMVWNGDGTISVFDQGATSSESPRKGFRSHDNATGHYWGVIFQIDYLTSLPADKYIAETPPSVQVAPSEILLAPGFIAHRLPLSPSIMPSALAWESTDDLIFGTLKGEIYRVKSTSDGGPQYHESLIVDGFATPYGIQAGVHPLLNGGNQPIIDVATKDGLLRVWTDDEGTTAGVETVAAGWGHTDDYHDWTVGLIRSDQGEYYVSLPCQQDQRSEAAAAYRGKIIKLTPRSKPTITFPRLFDIEIISAGHRFPMGMARNREGELFVTDNQGNYNPFNELNHVKKGAHFGFINALEKEKGFVPPPLTEPAINIPHPWTRSVNGICFLETPEGLRRVGSAHQDAASDSATKNKVGTDAKVGTAHPTSIFGPLEGHLVGCEYDTRRLIRMSLDKVNGEYQGCCYPLSIPPADVEKGLLGPIVCAIKPTTGELYVGEIRDSGWGASNNIGQITKIKIEPEKLPCGIAEVRATKNGFAIDFFKPVDRAKAANLDSYSIESYRRESTPAYGGPDIDRRPEKIVSAAVSEDGKRVTLVLPELRTRHVYELRLKNMTPGGGMFHPDEAHYTLKQIPKEE
ncbi:MAG TPA: PA14 domain-containing protein [Pirellulaceae bacterium]